MSNHSLSGKLSAAQTAIYNALEHAEIQKKLSAYGFTPKRLQEGNTLLNTALLLQDEKSDRYGEKQELSAQLRAQEKAVRELFGKHVATVRLAFRDEPATLSRFNISMISTKKEAWQMQASNFYRLAAQSSNVLSRYQLTAEELAQNQAGVEALIAARNRRLQKKGEAEEATRHRDQSLRELQAWMREFRTIARLALRDNPQLLEALGISVKSQKVA
jgi:hypothetical protein